MKNYDILNTLILNNININLNITIYVEQFLDDSCEKVDKEKCKTCCNNLKGNCFLCNDGYYLPIDSNNKKVRSACPKKALHKVYWPFLIYFMPRMRRRIYLRK